MNDLKQAYIPRQKPNADELSVRQVWGNEEVLCSFNCPFVSVVDSQTAFCSLFKRKLVYYDTGNGEICNRCEECMRTT